MRPGVLQRPLQKHTIFIFFIVSQIIGIFAIWYVFVRSSLSLRDLREISKNFHFIRNDYTEEKSDDIIPLGIWLPSNTSLPEYEAPSCIGRRFDWQAEDIFCLERPQYLPNYKNPCFDTMGQIRCLPYFQLLGADKCGSTDLFDRIIQHPEMDPSDSYMGKEIYYWCWLRHGVWMKTWNLPFKQKFSQYVTRFDHPAKYIVSNESQGYHTHITGDGTPMDFWDFRGWPTIPQNEGLDEPKVLTPHLMRHIYKDPKFLLILRNPTERLYSDYFFLAYGTSADTFHNHAIQAVAMVEKCLTVKSLRQCLYSPELYRDLPMRIHIGCYAVFLKEWFAVFPMSSFLILRTEDYRLRNKEHLRQVFQFLKLQELPDDQLSEISERKMKHVTAKKHAAGPMRNDTRAILDQFYSNYNRQLADLLQDNRFLWEDSAV